MAGPGDAGRPATGDPGRADRTATPAESDVVDSIIGLLQAVEGCDDIDRLRRSSHILVSAIASHVPTDTAAAAAACARTVLEPDDRPVPTVDDDGSRRRRRATAP